MRLGDATTKYIEATEVLTILDHGLPNPVFPSHLHMKNRITWFPYFLRGRFVSMRIWRNGEASLIPLPSD